MLNETTTHYNLEVDFFKGFLDPYMKYTSGLYTSPDDTLEIATQRMLDTIIQAANIKPGSKVLEIGPGWGALIKRMKERALICDYTGISPSAVQNAYIQKNLTDREQVLTTTFESFLTINKFDAIVLIGSFCHLKEKDKQLKKMAKMLNPGGTIVIEDTFFHSKSLHKNCEDNQATRFVQEKVFGFAEIFSLSETLEQVSEASLKMTNLLEHSNSYKTTIKQWIANLKKLNVQEFPDARSFIKYMHIAQRGWNNTTQNCLIALKNIKE